MCYLLGHSAATSGEIRTENLFLGQSAVSWRDGDVLFHSAYQQTTELFAKVVLKMCSLDWDVRCVHSKFRNSHGCLYSSKKRFSLENSSEVLMENCTFHITCHLDPDAKIRESKRALEGNGTKQRLKVYPYNSQGRLPRTGADFHQETLPSDRLVQIPAVQSL